MAAQVQRYLQIDEEGYWISDGLRITDEEYGRELFENLGVTERGSFFTEVDGEKIWIEAFDDPMVARFVQRAGDQLTLSFPYQITLPLQLESLSVDEWDRFHGRTEKGVPYVLSRAAQAALFEAVDEYDDDSLTVGEERFVLPAWLRANDQVVRQKFWTDIYRTEEPGWEMGRESVILPEILPQLKIPRSRILVLGCGTGHDVAFFAKAGHIATGVDFSDEAIERAKQNYSALNDIRFVQADVFKLPTEWTGQFDVVFDHTCYCAVNPKQRNELVAVWKRMLAEGGHLLGFFFTRDKMEGPPWGGSEWEIRQRLKNHFNFRYWTRWRKSIPKRQGYELVVWAQKKALL